MTRDRRRIRPGPVAAASFHASPQQAGASLAKALAQWLPERSSGQIAGLIGRRQVLLNGNVCTDAQRRLGATDSVNLLARPAAREPEAGDVVIRHADEHLIVVEKPAGITSVRERAGVRRGATRVQRQATLDELLPAAIREHLGRRRARSAERTSAVYPVHRLDRETSGLMIFARTPTAQAKLAAAFKRHEVRRAYHAVVAGAVEATTIESYLVRDRGDGRRGSSEDQGEGLHAVTHVCPLETSPGYTLVECRLETGRTHQIRIHLGERGSPVCGDRLYRKPPGARVIPDRSGATRLALHSAEMDLTHPVSGRKLSFRSEFPRELRELWRRLRAQEVKP